jgi:hypothetical protein
MNRNQAQKPCHCDVIANYMHWQDSLKPKGAKPIAEEVETCETVDSLGF